MKKISVRCSGQAQRQRLEEASKIDLGFPHEFLARPMTQAIMTGGLRIERRFGGGA
ncbi:hypothetical protein [Phyllobacterium sp. YR531]|uniref:hypothetical protein n=1 Tax=Phyllobacterium sp. YR531 TaxID=1144343 RepID=UPI0002F53771|nr:hypothetical protein [Phyllobacterium sp. YR531]